jgi:hypothetical protein
MGGLAHCGGRQPDRVTRSVKVALALVWTALNAPGNVLIV